MFCLNKYFINDFNIRIKMLTKTFSEKSSFVRLYFNDVQELVFNSLFLGLTHSKVVLIFFLQFALVKRKKG